MERKFNLVRLSQSFVLERRKFMQSRIIIIVIAISFLLSLGISAFYGWLAVTASGSSAFLVSNYEIVVFVLVNGSPSLYVAFLMGVKVGGSEYKNRNLVLTMIRIPNRRYVFVAKLCVSCIIATFGTGSSFLATYLVVKFNDYLPNLPPANWLYLMTTNVAVAAIWAIWGCCLGILCRAVMAPIIFLVIVSFFITPMVRIAANAFEGVLVLVMNIMPMNLSARLHLINAKELYLFDPKILELSIPIAILTLALSSSTLLYCVWWRFKSIDI